MPTPPPWWNETQVAPPTALISALRSGQSAMASLPSFIASVSRLRRRDRAGIEMIAADDDRRLRLARRTISLNFSPAFARSP